MAEDTENQVGYKKPPKASRFQKGRSGNPSGRPRKTPGIPEMLAKVSKQKILTNGKNGHKYMTKLEASITQLMNKSASGDLKAEKLLMEIMMRFPEIGEQGNMNVTETSVREKLLAALERHER
jgi:hypothetical protein